MEAVAEWPDEWFALNTGSLPVGAVVRAEQSVDGSTSALYTEAVGVLDTSITRPIFEPPLVGCSNVAVLNGVDPGARVQVCAANGACSPMSSCPDHGWGPPRRIGERR